MSTHVSFADAVAALRLVAPRFDSASVALQATWLTRVRQMTPGASAPLRAYYECLLFMCAYPANPSVRAQVEVALRRLQTWLRARRARRVGRHDPLLNSGMPYTDTVTRFSHDCTRWLMLQPDCRVALEKFVDQSLDLNAVLGLTLPLLERPLTTASLTNSELLSALGIPATRTLAGLVSELSRLDGVPFVKDHLFDALGVTVRVKPTNAHFSTAGNRLASPQTFYNEAAAPLGSAERLIHLPLPRARRLKASDRASVVSVIRNAMVLTSRETDPATYLDVRSLKVFDLERGLTVAIFGMVANRQLGLESYVGFTAFKNGLPVSYGGAWVLGRRAEFGMNVFEPYRGGESGALLCQLLRVYRHAFGLAVFEIDAHQFGLDNPDGIDSAAFWFYYKFGFRPLRASLAALARRERARLRTGRGLRTPKSLLRTFTGSNVVLRLSPDATPALATIARRVTRTIVRDYAGNRVEAEADCIARFTADTRVPTRLNADQRRVLADVALIARALNISDGKRLTLLAAMITAKPSDVYRYQQLVTVFFSA